MGTLSAGPESQPPVCVPEVSTAPAHRPLPEESPGGQPLVFAARVSIPLCCAPTSQSVLAQDAQRAGHMSHLLHRLLCFVFTPPSLHFRLSPLGAGLNAPCLTYAADIGRG